MLSFRYNFHNATDAQTDSVRKTISRSACYNNNEVVVVVVDDDVELWS